MCEESSKIKFGKIAWDADWVGFSRKLESKYKYYTLKSSMVKVRGRRGFQKIFEQQ